MASPGGPKVLSYAQAVSAAAAFKPFRVHQTAPDKKSIFGRVTTNFERLYADPSLKGDLRVHNVERLYQRALNPTHALFELPTGHFNSTVEMYQLIAKEVGPIIGATPITEDNQDKDFTLLDVAFKTTESVEKAITQGVVVKGVTYLATPSKRGDNQKVPMALTRVFIRYGPLVEDEELVQGMLESCQAYGRVLEISKGLRGAFYEGELSVLLDRSFDPEVPGEDKKYLPLQRSIVLTQWDIVVPVTYRGAPPICNQCRQVGHIKAECPQRRCYGCGQLGHFKRECQFKKPMLRSPTKQTPTQEAVVERLNVPNDPDAQSMLDSDREDDQEKAQVQENVPMEAAPYQEGDEDQCAQRIQDSGSETGSKDILYRPTQAAGEDEDMDAEAESRPGSPTGPSGTLYSKYAPMSTGKGMHVDNQEEMDELDRKLMEVERPPMVKLVNDSYYSTDDQVRAIEKGRMEPFESQSSN
ncbi:hypothetical protein BC940DRAFT_323784 [Gongronella butleri]|nr:hypothetical protein BC940DRAFT_323784 [Gongronella butleri]